MLDDLKLPVESVPVIEGATTAPTSYNAPTIKALTEELNRQGYTFSIQNQNVVNTRQEQKKTNSSKPHNKGYRILLEEYNGTLAMISQVLTKASQLSEGVSIYLLTRCRPKA